MSHFLSQRTTFRGLTLRGVRNTSWPRICVVLLFINSWNFLIAASVITYGVGMTTSIAACIAGNAICIGFYALSKMFVYLFLAERVHVVWATPKGAYHRFHSKLYMLCIFSVVVYGGITAVVIWGTYFLSSATQETGQLTCLLSGRVAYFRSEDGECIIGLKSASALALLAFDVYVAVLLPVANDIRL